jgi:hypothetical protein
MRHAHRLMISTTCLALALLATAILAPPAQAAGETAIDYLEPRADRQAYAELLEDLGVTPDERLIVDFLYSDYATELQDLADRVDARAEDAGRQRVQDALAGKLLIDTAELRELRLAVLRVYADSWTETDALLDGLIEETRALVMRSEDDFEAALRGFRRAVYLHPRRSDDRDESYVGHGVDVAELVAAARAPGAELEALDPADLDAALAGWVSRIDAYIIGNAAADRQGRLDRAVARAERDRTAQHAVEAEALERWQQLYRVNEHAVQQVADVAGQRLGADAARRWRERFDRACFPWLHRRTRADQVYAWMLRSRLDDAVVAEARTVNEAYEVGRHELLRSAAGLVLRGRLEHGVVLSSRMSPTQLGDPAVRGLYQELLKNSGERKQLEDDTVAQLEALLTPGQRDQMRADLAAAVHGRRR